MPSTIVSNDDVAISSRSLDYAQDGTLWFCQVKQSANDICFWFSTDAGQNWSEATSLQLSDAVTTLSWIGFFIDKDDGAHLAYFNMAGTAFEYRYGTPNGLGTGWTWSSPVVLESGSAYETSIQVLAHREGTGWVAHVFGSISNNMRHYIVDITSGHVPSLRSNTLIASFGNDYEVQADFHHEANDPKAVQGGAPHIYVAYHTINGSAVPLRYQRLAYSGGSWTVPGTVRDLDANTQLLNRGSLSLYYDGTRIVIAHVRSGTGTVVRVDERDEADTATTNRDPTVLVDGSLTELRCGYGPNGDIWLVAQAASSLDFMKIRYNRGGGTWGSWGMIEAESISDNSKVSLMRGVSSVEDAPVLGVAYLLQGPSPNQIRYSTLVAAWEGAATLQGVGSASAAPALGIVGQASLQGVGSVSAQATLALAGSAALQGVGTLRPEGTLAPFLDFTVFDGYLSGDGLAEALGLIYFEGEGFRNTEESQPLRPPRSDIGNEPTEVRPESGEIFSQQDFSNGVGQLYYHHEGRDVRRYLWSEGFDVDIDTVGRPATLLHLHDVPAPAYSSANVGEIVIFNDLPFVIDGTSFRRGNGDFPGGWTPDDPHATETATTIQDATSSGEYLYAALGANGIHRRDTSGAWTHWSDVQATRISWVKNRIIASDGQSIYEVISAGAAPAFVESLPVGWIFQDIFEVSGFVYAIVSNPTSSLTRVHAYGLNEGGTAVEKKSETPFPNDQLLLSGVGYLDTAFIGGGIRTPEGGYDPVVYQANVVDRDRGALSYAKITEGEGAGAIDLSVLAFEPMGENVLCGWSLGSGFPFGARDGLALYKLKNGAFFPYLKTSGAGSGRQVRSIVSYKGRILFSVRGVGLYYEEPTKYVASAYLISSVADWNTTAEKVWDTIQLSHNPLPAGTSVAIDYRTQMLVDEPWIEAVINSTLSEELDSSTFTELSSRLLAVRIRSNASSDQLRAPSGHGFLVRSNVLPDDAEWRLTRYVRILKRDRKDTGGEDIFIPDTHVRKRDIQLTTYKWVTLYEPGVIWTARMAKISNVTPLIPKFEETTGEERAEAYVMQLTLEGVRD